MVLILDLIERMCSWRHC